MNVPPSPTSNCRSAFNDEPQARRITFGPEHALDAVGLRADPHRIGPDVEPDSAGSRAIEHPSGNAERPHAHRKAGLHHRSAFLTEGELSRAGAGETPCRDPFVEVEPRIGVYTGHGALDAPLVVVELRVQPVRTVARRLRDHDPCKELGTILRRLPGARW